MYWSYRALLEDKKRCLTNIPTVEHTVANSLKREGEDAKISQRALAERKKHMEWPMSKDWHPVGEENATPRHTYCDDPAKPHFSHRELMEKISRIQTPLKRPASARPRLQSNAQSVAPSETDNGSFSGFAFGQPKMKELMQPGTVMDRRFSHERAALLEQRPRDVPHFSHESIGWKKMFHSTDLHARDNARKLRSQSARTFRDARGSSAGSDCSSVDVNKRLHLQNGKPGAQYRTKSMLDIDKRRHACFLDGDVEKVRDKTVRKGDPLMNMGTKQMQYDEALEQNENYRSQKAMTAHKKRHVAVLKEGGHAYTGKMQRYKGVPGSVDARPEELFNSYQTMEYGKRGHVVSLTSKKEMMKERRSPSIASTESSCDVGKGISAMMARHKDNAVHTSAVEFNLKKKNHATAVHATPLPPGEKSAADDLNDDALKQMAEKRRPSNPHNSCKAFALKKKYHQTGVNVTNSSRLHPEALKAPPLTADIPVMNSLTTMQALKKKHKFVFDPEIRHRPPETPVPQPPVPRNGQWTPQHMEGMC